MKTRKSRPMAVYWINLDRSMERRENMLSLLKDTAFDGMAKHRVKAYDGGDPDDEKKNQNYDSNYSFRRKSHHERICMFIITFKNHTLIFKK